MIYLKYQMMIYFRGNLMFKLCYSMPKNINIMLMIWKDLNGRKIKQKKDLLNLFIIKI